VALALPALGLGVRVALALLALGLGVRVVRGEGLAWPSSTWG